MNIAPLDALILAALALGALALCEWERRRDEHTRPDQLAGFWRMRGRR